MLEGRNKKYSYQMAGKFNRYVSLIKKACNQNLYRF